MNQFYFTSFADAYNCGAYGAGSFDEGTTCSSTTPPKSDPNPGGLINTGANFYVPLAIGVVLIVAAVTVLIASLKKRNKKTQ